MRVAGEGNGKEESNQVVREGSDTVINEERCWVVREGREFR